MEERATWQSKIGFLLAALGSAIGLGNVWRFPYIAFRNGGGAFLVPYFVALFVVGIPLLMLEFGVGHYFRSAFPRAMARIHPRFAWIGWWSVSFVMFGIVAYYAVVIAWCGNYLVFAVTQPWGDPANVSNYFDQEFLGYRQADKAMPVYEVHADGSGSFQFGRINGWVLLSLALVWLVNWLITRRHLQAGIERASKIFIPMLIALTGILVIWSWTFDGAAAGRQLYLTPDWQRAFQPQTWIDAFTQIFFTLSIGFGIMVAYGSYLPPESDIPTNTFLAAMGNCLFSVIAGFSVFAAIGFLAHEEGIDLAQWQSISQQLEELEATRQSDPAGFAAQAERYQALVAQHQEHLDFEQNMRTFGLVFKTYPALITSMGPIAGRIFGVLFFLSLLIAGISSSISIVEAFVAALVDQFGWRRDRCTGALCGIAFLLGIVFCTQTGIFWLDLVDHFITTYGLLLVAVCESVVVGWYFSTEKLRSHLDEYRDFRFGNVISAAMRVLITVVLLLTWHGLAQHNPESVANSLGRFLLLVSAVVLWANEHWLDFDIRVMIPALLLYLLDQALLRETQTLYEGYPLPAILGIGVTWLAGTLALGIVLAWISHRHTRGDHGG